jgi:CHAD domain-containing protein
MLAERGQMLTTQRTPISRRLAIRRAAHRPPRSWRQVGHRSIVAPLAATVAATFAIGVGVAVARAERERRASAKRRKRERRFGLYAGEPTGAGLRRIALGQIDVAAHTLRGDGAGTPDERVHEARKALKRLRALLRLLEDELGERAYERESAVVRDAGKRLSRARDAEVLLNTLDALIERQPKQLARRRGVQRLRAKLERERDDATAALLSDGSASDGSASDGALAELLGLRARVATWQLPSDDRLGVVEPALARIYGKGRKRMRRAARASGERSRGRSQHEWRKRVKDLRYVAEMLDRANGEARDKPSKRARGNAAFARKVAKRADDLGELLGADHDLMVLAERVRAEAGALGDAASPGRRSREALLQVIERRRKRLRKRALRDGERLYARSPKRFVKQMRKANSARS